MKGQGPRAGAQSEEKDVTTHPQWLTSCVKRSFAQRAQGTEGMQTRRKALGTTELRTQRAKEGKMTARDSPAAARLSSSALMASRSDGTTSQSASYPLRMLARRFCSLCIWLARFWLGLSSACRCPPPDDEGGCIAEGVSGDVESSEGVVEGRRCRFILWLAVLDDVSESPSGGRERLLDDVRWRRTEGAELDVLIPGCSSRC